MKTFFVTGLPRSRTAWLSALLTNGDSFCFHEVLGQVQDMDSLVRRMEATGANVVGISEPSLLSEWRKMNDRFPNSQWVLIERDPQDSYESFKKLYPDYTMTMHQSQGMDMASLSNSMNGQCLHVPYDKLDDYGTCKVIVQKCTGQVLGRERFDLLNALNVQQIAEKAVKYMTRPIQEALKPKRATGLICIQPIVTQEQLQAAMQAAKEDNHVPTYPTHTVLCDGEIVGVMCINSIPVSTFWASSTKLNARKTFELINFCKTMGNLASGKPIVTWCPKDSPIYPYMTKLGFKEHITTTHFIQEVT